MNKTETVAWHKHLIKFKKRKEKARQAQKAAGTTAVSPARR